MYPMSISLFSRMETAYFMVRNNEFKANLGNMFSIVLPELFQSKRLSQSQIVQSMLELVK